VTVAAVGLIVDLYGESATSAYASVDVLAKTEASIAWATLTPDAAWSLYDSVFLRPDYNDAS
jgi:hypothetical protein